MNHIKLKDIIAENQSQQWVKEAFEKDLDFLREKLIEEGLWDTIKQKVGGALEKTSDKAKELLLKPLIKVIMDKVAKDDPQGYAQLQQYASKDPKNIEKLMDHPDIKKQQVKVEKELQSVKENLTEQEADDFIQEYIDAVLEEARVLKDDPRNIKRRERYAQRKAARLAGTTTTGGTGDSYTVNVGGNKAGPTPDNKDGKSKTKNKSRGKESSPTDDISKGAAQLGRGLVRGADKLGIAAIEKTGDFVVGAGNLIKKGLDTKTGQVAKNAIGGLVSKVYSWAKAHPKITAGVALGLFGALFTAASIGSGGVIPLIMGTLGAGAAGAIKGGVAGYVTGAGKDMYRQIKGGADSFTKMNYSDVNKSGMKAGKTGAMIGGAIGAGTHVAGQALAGVGKMFGGNAAQAAQDVAKQGTEKAAKAAQDATQQAAQDTAQQTAKDTAQQAAEAALAAKQAVAAEKAAKGLAWVVDQHLKYKGAVIHMAQLKQILGHVGYGVQQTWTEELIRRFTAGAISQQALESYFAKLAMAAL